VDPTQINLQMNELDDIVASEEIAIAYQELVNSIKDGTSAVDVQQVRAVLQQAFRINPFEHIQVRASASGDVAENDIFGTIEPKRQLWSLLMFATYYDRTELVKHLLSNEYEAMLNPLALLRPPNSNSEYHIIPEDIGRNSLPRSTEGPSTRQLAIYHSIQNRNQAMLELLLTKFVQALDSEDLQEIAGFFLKEFESRSQQ